MVKTTESISKFSANNLGYIPMVVEQSGRGERAYDIYSRLLKERVIFKSRATTTLSIMSSMGPT